MPVNYLNRDANVLEARAFAESLKARNPQIATPLGSRKGADLGLRVNDLVGSCAECQADIRTKESDTDDDS